MFLAVACRSSVPQADLAASELKKFQFQTGHMGTMFYITLYASNNTQASEAAEAAFARVARLEEVLSDYQADSELSMLREAPVGQPVTVSYDLFQVMRRAQELSVISDGAFDATIGPYVRLWRFSRKRKELPSITELAAARAVVGYRHLDVNPAKQELTLKVPNMRLDVGGIAKGYAADAALDVLRSRGIDRAFVAASGDIAIGNPPPGEPGWRIAVSDSPSNALPRRLCLANAGVSTSGDVEQFVEIGGVRYAHIVSPWTGLGLTNRIQATLVSRNATTTDALATAVCILGVEKGMAMIRRVPGTEAFVIRKDQKGEIKRASRGFSRLLETGSGPASIESR
jgi:thiamine biosynthesis lipoprotein